MDITNELYKFIGPTRNTEPKVQQTIGVFIEMVSKIMQQEHNTNKIIKQLGRLVNTKHLFDYSDKLVKQLIYQVNTHLNSIAKMTEIAPQYIKNIKTDNSSHQHIILEYINSKIIHLTTQFQHILVQRTLQIERKQKLIGHNTLLHNTTSSMHVPDDIYQSNDYKNYRSQECLIQTSSNYYNERVNSCDKIEMDVKELGNMFNQLTTMINVQENLVERVDNDIDNASTTIAYAGEQITQTYESNSNNAALYSKLKLIVAIFFIGFISIIL